MGLERSTNCSEQTLKGARNGKSGFLRSVISQLEEMHPADKFYEEYRSTVASGLAELIRKVRTEARSHPGQDLRLIERGVDVLYKSR